MIWMHATEKWVVTALMGLVGFLSFYYGFADEEMKQQMVDPNLSAFGSFAPLAGFFGSQILYFISLYISLFTSLI